MLVNFMHEMAYVDHFLAAFGEFDCLNVVGHREDSQKAHLCMIPHVLSHCAASKSTHGSLQ